MLKPSLFCIKQGIAQMKLPCLPISESFYVNFKYLLSLIMSSDWP